MPNPTSSKMVAFVKAMNEELVASSKGSVRATLDSLIEIAGVSYDTYENEMIKAFKEYLGGDAVGRTDLFKLRLGDGFAYVRIDALADGEQRVRLAASLELILRSDATARFQADIEATKSDWTKLEYRGHNLFKIYTSRQFNDLIEEIIKTDEEITNPVKCDNCKLCEIVRIGGPDVCDAGREAIKKCQEEAKVDPKDIVIQEVYLGWNPVEDCFITGWDVWANGEEQITTGCVVISFKISDEGEVVHTEHSEFCPSNRRPDSIDDGSLVKFYDKSGRQQSLYSLISGCTNEAHRVIDIRLD